MMVITNKVLNNKKGYILVALFLYNYTKVLVRRSGFINNLRKEMHLEVSGFCNKYNYFYLWKNNEYRTIMEYLFK